MLVGEHGGDPMLPRIAMMKALHQHEPKAVPEARQSLQSHSIDQSGALLFGQEQFPCSRA
jgi:hypothetical protein